MSRSASGPPAHPQAWPLLPVLALGLLAGWLMAAASAPRLEARLTGPAAAVALADRAHAMVSDNPMQAFEAFDADPDTNRPDLHLFVLAGDGINLYHAADRTLIGTDFAPLTDADGRPYGRALIGDAAAAGVWHVRRLPDTAARRGWQLIYARQTPQGHIVAAALRAGRLG